MIAVDMYSIVYVHWLGAFVGAAIGSFNKKPVNTFYNGKTYSNGPQ